MQNGRPERTRWPATVSAGFHWNHETGTCLPFSLPPSVRLSDRPTVRPSNRPLSSKYVSVPRRVCGVIAVIGSPPHRVASLFVDTPPFPPHTTTHTHTTTVLISPLFLICGSRSGHSNPPDKWQTDCLSKERPAKHRRPVCKPCVNNGGYLIGKADWEIRHEPCARSRQQFV